MRLNELPIAYSVVATLVALVLAECGVRWWIVFVVTVAPAALLLGIGFVYGVTMNILDKRRQRRG
jgi:hypothetical protein